MDLSSLALTGASVAPGVVSIFFDTFVPAVVPAGASAGGSSVPSMPAASLPSGESQGEVHARAATRTSTMSGASTQTYGTRGSRAPNGSILSFTATFCGKSAASLSAAHLPARTVGDQPPGTVSGSKTWKRCSGSIVEPGTGGRPRVRITRLATSPTRIGWAPE